MNQRLTVMALLLSMAPFVPGCLAISGDFDVKSEPRLRSLEQRVDALEQTLYGGAVQVPNDSPANQNGPAQSMSND